VAATKLKKEEMERMMEELEAEAWAQEVAYERRQEEKRRAKQEEEKAKKGLAVASATALIRR